MHKRKVRTKALALLITLVAVAHAQTAGNKVAVSSRSLCVTEGTVEGLEGNQFKIDDPKMRAYVNSWTAQAVETRFTYLGPTSTELPLGSGEVRHQFGLKLRAQNACNLVYVMWRFEPQSTIVVSVKKNPGQTTSAECGNRGYENINAARSQAVPPVRPGDFHDLDAEMHGTGLTVTVDGNAVWQGDVGPDAAALIGPVGIRSDNVRLKLDLAAAPFEGPHPMYLRACRKGPDVSD